ncbi:MAG: FkbM family methyltransferase [Verrucomicrobia bacterium]|nr:FkbM family methyltransferase [Verrucomicrobiota bacterium]
MARRWAARWSRSATAWSISTSSPPRSSSRPPSRSIPSPQWSSARSSGHASGRAAAPSWPALGRRSSSEVSDQPSAPNKAGPNDYLGRCREVISDPLNLLIERVPEAGAVEGDEVYLHNGHLVPWNGAGAYYGSFSQLLILNRGVHEPLEEYVFQELLKTLPEAPRMIELGAYWSHYSMWLKKVRPAATTIMVEADPNNLEVGRANFARNGYEGEFITAMVARCRWELDRFVRARRLEHIDILHVDIQGYELQFLKGARGALSKQLVDYVFISTHSQDIHRNVVSELLGLNYRVEVSSDYDHETTSFDGFVFASSLVARQIFNGFRFIGRAQISGSSAAQLVDAMLDTRKHTRGCPAKEWRAADAPS